MSDNPPAPVPASASEEPRWAKPTIGIYSLSLFVIALGIAYMAKSDTALTLLLGMIGANATTVIGYYFGSSAGSAQKTAQMNANKGPTP